MANPSPIGQAWAPSAALAYHLAVGAGLTPKQATDFAAVQYGESGFNPNARNKTSGAAGLYQLLSQGYVNRANQLGGVLNPVANIKAILPSYLSYYQTHPQLVPGAAGAAVEASGQPASYYAQGWQHLGDRGVPMPQSGGGASPGVVPSGQAAAPATNPRLMQILLATRQAVGLPAPGHALTQALQARYASPAATVAPQTPVTGNVTAPTGGGIAELLREGTGGPTHSTGPHVHAAFTDPNLELAAIRYAQQLGLHVGENPYVGSLSPSVHAAHSYHNVTFPGLYNGKKLGEAIDVSGGNTNPFYAWLAARQGPRS